MQTSMIQCDHRLHQVKKRFGRIWPCSLSVTMVAFMILLSSCSRPDNTINDGIPNLGMAEANILFLEQKGDWGYVIVVDEESRDCVAFGTLCLAKSDGRTYWTHDEIIVLRRKPTTIQIEKKFGTRHYSVQARSYLSNGIREGWQRKLIEVVEREGLDARFPGDLFGK